MLLFINCAVLLYNYDLSLQEQPVEDSAVRAGPVRRVEGSHPLLQQVLKDSTRRLPAQETGAHHRRRQPGLGTPPGLAISGVTVDFKTKNFCFR